MELSNKQPMVVSEHKRTSFDKNGAVAKVDVLRSIRRKDTPPSFLPSQQTQKNQQAHSESSKFKDIIEYLLIATIIFCSLLLILSFCGFSLQINNESTSVIHQQSLSNIDNRVAFIKENNTVKDHSEEFSNFANLNTVQTILGDFYDRFQNQFMRIKFNESLSENYTNPDLQMNLNEREIKDKDVKKLFLQRFVQTFKCGIQSNKLICEHNLHP